MTYETPGASFTGGTLLIFVHESTQDDEVLGSGDLRRTTVTGDPGHRHIRKRPQRSGHVVSRLLVLTGVLPRRCQERTTEALRRLVETDRAAIGGRHDV